MRPPLGLGRRVLTVDDDDEVPNALAWLLQHVGYAVATAREGPEVLALLRAAAFDLTLPDTSMPGTGEADSRSRQVENPVLSAIPVPTPSGETDAEEPAAHCGVAHCPRGLARADKPRSAWRHRRESASTGAPAPPAPG